MYLKQDFQTKKELIRFCEKTNIRFVRSAVITALTRFATNKVANNTDYNVSYNLRVQERKDGIGIWFDVRVKNWKYTDNYAAVQVLVAIPYYGRKSYVEVSEF